MTWPASRLHREDRSVAVGAPVISRTVQLAIDVDEARLRLIGTPRAVWEVVKYGLLAGRGDLEDRSATVRATATRGCSVERALDVDETRVLWLLAISRVAAEAMEHRFLSGRRDREDRSLAIRAPIEGCTVKFALDVDEDRRRVCAIP